MRIKCCNEVALSVLRRDNGGDGVCRQVRFVAGRQLVATYVRCSPFEAVPYEGRMFLHIRPLILSSPDHFRHAGSERRPSLHLISVLGHGSGTYVVLLGHACQRMQGTHLRSQSLTEASKDPLATTLASSLNSTVLIFPICPAILRMVAPVDTSHRKTDLSPPDEANLLLS